MAHLIPIILFLIAAPLLACAQDDTVFIGTKPVVVDADRLLGDGMRATQPRTVIGAAMLERLMPQQASDALMFAPGVAIRQYGGLGGLRTVSIRGGSTAQALVLLDGVRLSSAQNGSVDLGLIPGALIGEIEVIRGGAAALYGANALSGVVDIRLRTPSRASAWATVGGGSFDEVVARAAGTAAIGSVGVMGAVDAVQAQGGYPTAVRHDGTAYDVNRTNSDVRAATALVRVQSNTWSAFAIARTALRGVPSPIIDGVITPNRARLYDADVILGMRGTIAQDGPWTCSLTYGMRAWDQLFQDPDATVMGPTGIDERYVQRDASSALTLQHVTESLLQRVTVEGSFADLRGRMLQPDVGSLVIRRSVAVAGDWQWQPHEGVMMRGAVRADALSDAGLAVSPLIAVRWDVVGNLALRASWSYNFRPPSFNELYYLNYGTSTLRPERSHTLNGGFAWRPFWNITVEADAFAVRTSDLILAVPTSAIAISAQNIGMSDALGIELGIRSLFWADRLMLHWAYTLQDVRDRSGRDGVHGTLLPYVPQEVIAAGMHLTISDYQAGATWQHTSHRYTLAGEAWSSALPQFSLFNMYVGVTASVNVLHATVRFQADNIFDTRYEIIQGFPMPGASFRLLTTLRWGT